MQPWTGVLTWLRELTTFKCEPQYLPNCLKLLRYLYANNLYIARLRQQCHNSKFVIFQEKSLKVLKCCHFLWVQGRHSCSPAASFANCVMKLHLLKAHLQTFLSTPVTQKCQILSCDTLVANKRYIFPSQPIMFNTSIYFKPFLVYIGWDESRYTDHQYYTISYSISTFGPPCTISYNFKLFFCTTCK